MQTTRPLSQLQCAFQRKSFVNALASSSRQRRSLATRQAPPPPATDPPAKTIASTFAEKALTTLTPPTSNPLAVPLAATAPVIRARFKPNVISSKPIIPPLNDPLLEYLTNHVMKDGKKARAQQIVTNMLAEIHRQSKSPPLPILRHALFMISPSVRIMSEKGGAKTRLIPKPLNDKQRTSAAIKWLLQASASRSEHELEVRLANEIRDIVKRSSSIFKKKEDVHKLAMANRSQIPGIARR